jgi:hypothetical protein
MVAEINCNDNTITYREMTAEEIAAQEAMRVESEAKRAEHEASIAAHETLKASAKAKLIAGQPLTEEEAATIVF